MKEDFIKPNKWEPEDGWRFCTKKADIFSLIINTSCSPVNAFQGNLLPPRFGGGFFASSSRFCRGRRRLRRAGFLLLLLLVALLQLGPVVLLLLLQRWPVVRGLLNLGWGRTVVVVHWILLWGLLVNRLRLLRLLLVVPTTTTVRVILWLDWRGWWWNVNLARADVGWNSSVTW